MAEDLDTNQAVGLRIQTITPTNINGVLPIEGNASIQAREKLEEAEAEERRKLETAVTGLAGYVKGLWSDAHRAKHDVEQRMLASVRQRRGIYDPQVLTEIRKFGGSEVYMMLTSNKCRTATAWLKDAILGQGEDKPWTIAPTKEPEISPEDEQAVMQEAVNIALQVEQSMNVEITPQIMKEISDRVQSDFVQHIYKEANEKLRRMETKMEDQLQEGGFIKAIEDCIDDVSTFPTAILKGPVIRKKKRLSWKETGDGGYEPVVEDTLVEEWERVDPFMLYPSPQSSGIGDGYLFERHRLSRGELEAMKGVEGYSLKEIDEVLLLYGTGGLNNWLSIDSERSHAEGKESQVEVNNADELIDALQFWGSVQGKRLKEWGMSDEDIPDETKEYKVELWLIGANVIKAVINPHPLAQLPYYTASYEEIPGTFWGNAPTDLIRDCQAVCNATARAIVNNVGIASGPQVDINTDRLPAGEDITEMYPWKIWQTRSDPYGSTANAVNFFQPNIMANELMGVYERFSTMADEYSSIPRYMTGDASTGGAGRTASGMSMLMSNAGKGIKNVVRNIDSGIIGPAVKALYMHNMEFSEDPELKGDINVVAKGANSLVVKEQAQLRRNEFLQLALNSPVVSEVVGQEGIAALLREGAKALDMDSNSIVPSKQALQAKQVQQTMAMRQAQQQPQPSQGQTLENGAPVTNNFQDMKS